jgi:L-amino acid N-acyltransferase YncA
MTSETLTAGASRARLFLAGPLVDGAAAATLGEFDIADPEEGRALLDGACRTAAARGARQLLAPMDGDTWRSYRAVVESDGSPPFLLEPRSGPHDVAVLEAAGFVSVARYVSSRTALADLDLAPARDGFRDRAAPADAPAIRVESWDGDNAEGMLREAFSLSLAAFAENPYFKPIAFEAFLAIYRPLLPALDRDFVLFAREPGGRIAGFLFGLPNLAEGPAVDSVILKTYASRAKGAGRALADAFHRRARERGFRTAIHALMHEANVSADRSGRYRAEIFRRYALFTRPL